MNKYVSGGLKIGGLAAIAQGIFGATAVSYSGEGVVNAYGIGNIILAILGVITQAVVAWMDSKKTAIAELSSEELKATSTVADVATPQQGKKISMITPTGEYVVVYVAGESGQEKSVANSVLLLQRAIAQIEGEPKVS